MPPKNKNHGHMWSLPNKFLTPLIYNFNNNFHGNKNQENNCTIVHFNLIYHQEINFTVNNECGPFNETIATVVEEHLCVQ